LIGWPRTLSWSHFQALTNPGPGVLVARNGQPIVARVSVSFMFYPGGTLIITEGGQARFHSVDVRVLLNPAETQYVPSRLPAQQADYYLRHEQGHFDLMGLFGRELEVELTNLRAENSQLLHQRARAAVDEALRSARMYAINSPGIDCVYDRETNHGINRAQQERWNRRIAANLRRWMEPDFRFRM
jgi:hypothetical protein